MTSTELAVRSSVFRDGHTIPQSAVFNQMGYAGVNQSPDIGWFGAPPTTKSYAITVWDPDAPTGPVGFVHWVLFNIPSTVTSIRAGAGGQPDAGVGATHGLNDFGAAEYDGPAPPPGDPPHHYRLTVYALDVEQIQGLQAKSSYALFRFLSRTHVLATGEIVGLYGVPPK